MTWVQLGTAANPPYPNGIALDSAQNLYVADPVNQTVTKWSQTGQLLLTIGYNFNVATGGLQVAYPNGVAVDSSGNIWVSDTSNNLIIKFSSTGAFISQLTTAGSTVLNQPRGLWIDASGNLWAALSGSAQIVEFFGVAAPSASSVVYSSTAAYLLYNPYGVCTDSSGNIYIADYSSAANRVLKISTTGSLLQTFTGLSTPQGVAVDSAGNVYVANNGNSTVVKFNAAGSIVAIYGGGNLGPNLIYPYAVALDSSNNIYISDTSNQTVIKITQRSVQLCCCQASHRPSCSLLSSPRSRSVRLSVVLHVVLYVCVLVCAVVSC